MTSKPTKKKMPESPRAIENRRARHNYEFLETHEAGIVLAGSEVKSVWLGRVNMIDAYCQVRGSELWVVNLDIEPYSHASRFQLERRRERKLLMHRREIDLLDRKSNEKGLALIPSRMYFKNGKAKIAVSLARGKREYDKRQQIAKKDSQREIEQARSLKY